MAQQARRRAEGSPLKPVQGVVQVEPLAPSSAVKNSQGAHHFQTKTIGHLPGEPFV